MMKRIHKIEVAQQAQREKNRQREQEKEYQKTLKKGLTGRGIFGMIMR